MKAPDSFKKALSILMALVFAAVPALIFYFASDVLFGRAWAEPLACATYGFSLYLLLKPSSKE